MKVKSNAVNAVALTAIAAGLLAMSGCAGQNAPYANRAEQNPQVELIPVTPAYIREQRTLSTAFLKQQELIQLGMESLGRQSRALASDYKYVIGPADLLLISVPTIVSFNSGGSSNLGEQGQSYTVFDDGTIFLPYTGPVRVGGLTLREAQSKVVEALSKYLRQPQVVVAVREYRSQRVLVTGQLSKPGYVPITDVPLTLIGSIAAAGGATEVRGGKDPRPVGGSTTGQQVREEIPDLEHVILKRDGQSYEVNVSAILASGDVNRDVLLKNGDVVVVPPTRRGAVAIMGEVMRPALFEVAAEDTNLAQVLMAAGGFNQLTANAERVYVIRGDFSKPTVFQVNAKSPDAMLLAQQFPIESKDVIFVSLAPIAKWNRALQQVLPSLQSLLSTAIFVDRVDAIANDN